MSRMMIHIECREKTAETLQHLFSEMARAYDIAAANQERQNETVPAGHVRNAKGWLMPVASVKQKDLLEDALVERCHLMMAAVAEGCRMMRLGTHSECDALIGMIVADAGGDGSTQVGKVTLQNLAATRRITIDRRDTMAFGAEVAAARDKVMSCVRKWSDGANPHLVALANAAFQANGNGELSVSKVASLWRIECDDPEWKDAMTALKDSLRVAGQTTYVRMHERQDPDGKWELIEAKV